MNNFKKKKYQLTTSVTIIYISCGVILEEEVCSDISQAIQQTKYNAVPEIDQIEMHYTKFRFKFERKELWISMVLDNVTYLIFYYVLNCCISVLILNTKYSIFLVFFVFCSKLKDNIQT